MKDFLWSQWDPTTISEESFRDEIAIPLFCWRRLAACFRHSHTTPRLLDVFGGTLADLPWEIFDKLRAIDPVFNFPDGSLASVQSFDTGRSGRLIVVTFVEKTLELSDMVLRGIFFHEYGHLALGHHDGAAYMLTKKEKEIGADALALSWGFIGEIEQKNEHLLFQTKGGV